MDVGIRELRSNLSQYVARVRAGETITVTDHGKPVAQLTPLAGQDKLSRLIAEGKVTPARNPSPPGSRWLPEPLPLLGEGTVSELIIEDRDIR
jgi:prevent-host-death family protein